MKYAIIALGTLLAFANFAQADGNESARARYVKARTILDQKCQNCHVNYHMAWDDYSEEDFFKFGDAKKGDLKNSPIFTSLQQVGGNMPPEHVNPLTAEDFEAIVRWIYLAK